MSQNGNEVVSQNRNTVVFSLNSVPLTSSPPSVFGKQLTWCSRIHTSSGWAHAFLYIHRQNQHVLQCTKMPKVSNELQIKISGAAKKHVEVPFARQKIPTTLQHGTESFLRSWGSISFTRNSRSFMKPQGLSPRPQEPL